MSLPRFGVTKPVPVNLLMAATIICGIVAALTLRREFFPESDPDRAQILLIYPGANPEEIEESMAHKVEDAVAEIEEVDRIITTISEGGGSVMAEFRSGADVRKVVDDIKSEIDALTDLPEEAEQIRVLEFEPNLPVIMLTLYGDADEEVMKQSIRRIRDDLKKLPGMGDIAVSGVRGYEVRVDISQAALLEHGLSLPQVNDAIQSWMADVPGGSVRTNVGNINVRTMGVAERAEAIRQIVVKATASGQSLRVSDIGEVREDFMDEQVERRFNGQPAVSLTAFKSGRQDAVKIAEMVRSYVAGRKGENFQGTIFETALGSHRKIAWEMGHNHPEPLPAEIATHSDLARFIEGRLALLTSNAQQGALLVIMTLLIFLNWRAAFWVMIGLITAICGTIVLMSVLDITLNLLTMFGLIIVVGMLVDDGIVVAENIQARHDRGDGSLDAAVKGAEEVFWPVVGAVTTTIVAFLPLTFLQGRIGDLLGALPFVVACALVASLVESLLILPSHIGHSLVKRDKLKPGRLSGKLRAFEVWRDHIIADRILPAYERLLRLLLEYRYITTFSVLAILIISLGMVAGGRLPFTFLSSTDAETIIVDIRMPIGTPLEEMERIARKIEEAAAAQAEVKTVGTILGQRSDVDMGIVDANATHLGQIFIELLPVEFRQDEGMLESAGVIDAMRRHHGLLDGVENLRYSEISGAGSGADITIEVAGDDSTAVTELVAGIKKILAARQGVYDISDDNFNNQREVQIALKPAAAALGFTVEDVARQVRGALYGLRPHVFSAKREDIDVRVRLDEASRRNLGAIENMWVFARTPNAPPVPLQEIAELREGVSFSTIRRIDRQRAVTITADTAPDTNPELIVDDITPELNELAMQYPNVEVNMGGRQRDFTKAFASLPLGMGAAVLMIYVVLAWLFSSYIQPLLVMLAIPFGIIGVVWGHIIFGYEATFLSLIGFIALCGIVVNNSLILVQFYNTARASGESLRDALVHAGRQRLRPIVLTSITTFLGLTPLMLQQSFQAKFLIPMAISVSFGLISSALLVLTALPCFMVIVDDLKAVWHFLWFGIPREAELQEKSEVQLDSE